MSKKVQRLQAVIDIGAHSIRMYLGEVIRKGSYRKLEELWVPIMIGRDTFSKGVVSNQTILEMIKILKNFTEVIKTYQVDDVKAFATSSIREASNADVLLERVKSTTGINIQIIDPIEEIEFLYRCLCSVIKDRYRFLQDNVLIFSPGGGSTQIILQSKGEIVFTETLGQGTLRFLRFIKLPERYFDYLLSPMIINFKHTMLNYVNLGHIDRFIALNDDVIHLIKGMEGEKEVGGIYRLSRKDFTKIYNQFKEKTMDELNKMYQLKESMVGTTMIAILMIGKFFQMTQAQDILFPDITLTSAVLRKLTYQPSDPIFDKRYKSNIISSAIYLGRKYHFAEAHALLVQKLALSMYDQLSQLYGWNERERLYLEVAALLHDIGTFINPSSHHKHSETLVMSSEILGLNKYEMKLISQIVRYHRKALPKPTHLTYMSLPRDDRVMVSRLAAILRVADGLDNIHSQIVEDVKLTMSDTQCDILLKLKKGYYDYWDIIKMAAKRKSDMFENFFGVPIYLEMMV